MDQGAQKDFVTDLVLEQDHPPDSTVHDMENQARRTRQVSLWHIAR
jgi:hypothetical protein